MILNNLQVTIGDVLHHLCNHKERPDYTKLLQDVIQDNFMIFQLTP
jgi:hypothetical protein